jgi:choice-of-anchor B domain-containing protein
VANIPGARSIWRDMKTFGDYIYVVADTGADGLLMINMSEAPARITWEFWKPTLTAGFDTRVLQKCHNIYIDENGICYLSGSNINGGGILMVDVKSDPGNPRYIGPATFRYSHDVFVRGDTIYSSDINDGFFSITSVKNKQAPELLAFQNTSRNYTHNSGLSDDGNYLFTTDERENAFVDAYDISDLDNIKRIDTYRPLATEGTGVIPHNVHYLNGFLVISYYSDGVKIVDAHRPDNLIEVGGYDTTPLTGNADGCWGVYPFLNSGKILASDMDLGLFVLEPNYLRAAYLEGLVRDAQTRLPLSAVEVSIKSQQSNSARSEPDGRFRTGIASSGSFSVTFTKPGYEEKTQTFFLNNGDITDGVVDLVPILQVPFSGNVINQQNDIGIPAQLLLKNDNQTYQIEADENGRFDLDMISIGVYDIWAAAWGFQQKILANIDLINTSSITIELEPGFEDNFSQDLGWTTTSTATSGDWVRVQPIATDFEGSSPNPSSDLESDFGDLCYVTGNGEGGAGLFDVDNGIVTLSSPLMDLADLVNPSLNFAYWFFNGSGEGIPDDHLRISISNGITEVDLLNTTDNTNGWQERSFLLKDYIDLTSTMVLLVETSDLNNPHLVEAGFDAFSIQDEVTTSIQDLSKINFDLSVFPNPTSGQFNVRFQIPENLNQVQFNVINQFGQQLSSRSIATDEGAFTLGTELPAGIYFLQLIDASGNQAIKKVIKQ